MRKAFSISKDNLTFYKLINNKSDAINYLLKKAKNDKEFLNKFFTQQDLKFLKELKIIKL